MSASIKSRKKKAPVADVPADASVEAISPLPSRVSLADLWAMRLAQTEKRAAEAELEAARMSRLYVLAKLDPKGMILGVEKKMDVAKKLIEAAENRALIAKKRMEHTLGRPLAGLSIDPDSGEVQVP